MLGTHDRTQPARPDWLTGITLLSLAASLALAGCASSAPSGRSTPPATVPNATTAPSSDSPGAFQTSLPTRHSSATAKAPVTIPTPNDSLIAGSGTDVPVPAGQTEIGTYRVELEGNASYTLTYFVGQPTTDDSSPDIQPGVAACGDVTPETSVYVPYTVVLHYNGRVPTTVDFGNHPDTAPDAAMSQDFGAAGSLELPIAAEDGNWTCYGNQYQFRSFHPGSTETFKAVFIANGYLTNSRPTFDPAAHTNWNLGGSEVTFVSEHILSISADGPNKCGHDDRRLSLFGEAGDNKC